MLRRWRHSLYAPPMATFSCCTIVARNYLPRARVLAESLRRHHPDVTLWVLVIDAELTEWADGEPFSGLSLEEVGLGGPLGREMAAVDRKSTRLNSSHLG